MMSRHSDIVCFDRYRFDVRRLDLTGPDGPVALRPKTACLLALFLRHSDELLSKADIIAHVWQSAHVQDQSLFQAVSELRRVLAPLEPITTQPNQGYRWNRPVSVPSPVRGPAALAASLLLVFGLAIPFALPDGGTNRHSSSLEPLPPSLRAFSSGMQHLEQSRIGEAQRYFALALRENPDFDEARLMLAETLFAQGRTQDARAQASELLQSPMDVDAYTMVSAMSLIGRSQSSDGDSTGGLHWAQAAAQHARDEGFACAAANLEDVVATLLKTKSPEPDATLALTSAGKMDDDAAVARPDFCLQIDAVPGGPGAQVAPDPCFSTWPARRELV